MVCTERHGMYYGTLERITNSQDLGGGGGGSYYPYISTKGVLL